MVVRNRTGNFFIDVLFKIAGEEKVTPEQLTIAKNAITYIRNELPAIREQEIALYQKFIQENLEVKPQIAFEKFTLDVKDHDGQTMLAYAATYGHPLFIKFLIESKADLDMSGKTHTALTSAISSERLDNVKALLALKANPDAANQIGDIPLTVAAEFRRADIIRELIDAKADINSRPANNDTPLIRVCRQRDNNKSVETILTLLEKKADINAPHLKKGNTPLITSIVEGNINLLRVLLTNKADSNIPEFTTGKTPLIYAAIQNNAAMIQSLLEAKAYPNAINEQTGDTAFTEAAQLAHTDIMQVLISAKADVNAPHAKTGDFPLIHILKPRKVISYGWEYYNDPVADCVKSARLLLDAKSDPNLVNLKNGDSPLFQAVIINRSDILQMLLEANADANVYNKEGKTVLTESIIKKHNVNSIKLLLKAKAIVNKPAPETTPLIEGIKIGSPEVVQVLLDAKAFPNMINETSKETPLTVAVSVGNKDIVDTLLRMNADVNQPNNKTEEAPLTIAAYYGITSILKSLIDARANIEYTERGKTALDFAIGQSHLVDISLLLDHKATLYRPYELYSLLLTQDLHDFMTFNLFTQLYEQQMRIKSNDRIEPTLKLQTHHFLQLETDYKQIIQAISVTTVSDALLNESMCQFLPPPLRAIVRAYDFPLDRVGFFENRVVSKELGKFLESNQIIQLEKKLAGLHEELRQKKKKPASRDLFSTSDETLWENIVDLTAKISELKNVPSPKTG